MSVKDDEERRKRLAQYIQPDYAWDTASTGNRVATPTVSKPTVKMPELPTSSTASFATRKTLNLTPITQGIEPPSKSTLMPGSNTEYWEKGMPKTAANQNKPSEEVKELNLKTALNVLNKNIAQADKIPSQLLSVAMYPGRQLAKAVMGDKYKPDALERAQQKYEEYYDRRAEQYVPQSEEQSWNLGERIFYGTLGSLPTMLLGGALGKAVGSLGTAEKTTAGLFPKMVQGKEGLENVAQVGQQIKGMIPFGTAAGLQAEGQAAKEYTQTNTSEWQSTGHGKGSATFNEQPPELNALQKAGVFASNAYFETTSELAAMPQWFKKMIGSGGADMIEAGSQVAAKSFGKRFIDYASKHFGIDLLKEGAQEAMVDPPENAAAKAIYKPDMKMFGKEGVVDPGQMAEDFAGGMLMSVMMSGFGLTEGSKGRQVVEDAVVSDRPFTEKDAEIVANDIASQATVTKTVANVPGLGQVELVGKPTPNTTNILDATGSISEVNDALLKNADIQQMQVPVSNPANQEAAPEEVTPARMSDEQLTQAKTQLQTIQNNMKAHPERIQKRKWDVKSETLRQQIAQEEELRTQEAVTNMQAAKADYEKEKTDFETYTKQLARENAKVDIAEETVENDERVSMPKAEAVKNATEGITATEEARGTNTQETKNVSISETLMSKQGQEAWDKIAESVKKDNPNAKLSLVRAKSGFQKHISKIMKSQFGTEVVFYKGDSNVNGFVDPRVSNTIFVKVSDDRNEMMQTTAHEFLHVIAKRHAEDYKALLEFGQKHFGAEAIAKYQEAFKDKPRLYEAHKADMNLTVEEMLADELGNNFTNHSFWDNLYSHSKELFEKLVKIAKGMIDEINKYGSYAAKNTSEWKTVTYVGEETTRVLSKEFEKTITSVRSQVAEGKVDTTAKIADSLYDRKDGKIREKYNGDALTPLEDIIKFALKKEQWRADQSTPEFGSVNNRMLKELEVTERLFGKIPESYTANMPGKLEGNTRPLVRTITPSSLGKYIYDMVQKGEAKFLMEAPIEEIVRKRGLTDKEAKLLRDDLKSIRGNQPILSDNGKAGKSIDFLLGTCHPTRPCKECYAASAYIRMSAVRKAMRNTIRVYIDPFKFGREAAKEVKKVDKFKLPFVRLLGSGDLTSDEQVDAFNTLAENIDRPIHIFSRHHDMLGRLISRPNAPFIKMGSIDIQLYEVYGVDYLANNLSDRGIANVFLYTSPTEFNALKSLKDRDAVKLILSASHELHDTLDKDKEIQASSCPCDAGERSYMHSCVQCAMSDMGCFMSFSTMGVDVNGKVWDYMDENAPDDLTPIAVFGNESESRSKAYAKVAVSVIKKSIELINLYERAFKKGERNTIPLKDIRFNGEDSVSYVDNVEAAEWYKGKLKEMVNAAAKGSFYLPGGEIQPEVYFEKGRRVTNTEKVAQAKENVKVTLAPHLKASAINTEAINEQLENEDIKYSAAKKKKEVVKSNVINKAVNILRSKGTEAGNELADALEASDSTYEAKLPKTPGKIIDNKRYIHVSAEDTLNDAEKAKLEAAKKILAESKHKDLNYNLLVIGQKENYVSFKSVPDFDNVSEPTLYEGVTIKDGKLKYEDGKKIDKETGSEKYQIYHQKATMVKPGYDKFNVEAERKRIEEWKNSGIPEAKNVSRIGWDNYWKEKILDVMNEPGWENKVADRVAKIYESYLGSKEEISKLRPWGDVQQKVTSGETSINDKKFPKTITSDLFIQAVKETLNRLGSLKIADIGGGKFDNVKQFLEQGLLNPLLSNDLKKKYREALDPVIKDHRDKIQFLIYDKFNRAKAHNDKVTAAIKGGQSDIVTVNNVLNVIDEPAARAQVIINAADAVKPDGTVLILPYVGNQSGLGDYTQEEGSWQTNRVAQSYVPEIKRYFDDVSVKDGIIVAKKPKKAVLTGEKDIKYSVGSNKFKAWFKDSEVVNEDGSPMVVYHGTSASEDFNVFTTNKNPEEPGTHFGTQEAAADFVDPDYARGTGERVYPVYLSIQHALETPDLYGDIESVFYGIRHMVDQEQLKQTPEWADVVSARRLYKQFDANKQVTAGLRDSLVNYLKGLGYDGLKYTNNMEDVGSTSWVTFDPNQIKSAIGNNGDYDPNNNDIRYSAGQKFKQWFKDSVVVDDDGDPLKVYHGSTEDFDTFDKNKINPNETDAVYNGFWFSTDKNTSPAWRNANHVKSYYLSMQNPAPSSVYWKLWEDLKDNISEELYNEYDTGSLNDIMRYKLQELGYDGVIHTDRPKINWDQFEKAGEFTYQTARGNYYTIAKNEEYGGIDLYKGKGTYNLITGYTDKNDFMKMHDERVYVVFEPNQIKSADNNNGDYDPDNLNTKYSAGQKEKEMQPTFYSKLQQTVQKKMANAAAPNAVMSLLRNNGVKEEEITWSGIEDFLDGKNKVSKAELMDFLKTDELYLREIVKGDITEDPDYMYDAVARSIKTRLEYNDEVNREVYRLIDKWAKERTDEAEYELKMALLFKTSVDFQDVWDDVADSGDGARYKEYASKGGKNYREMLITIPDQAEGTYLSAHWDEENVLAHTRLQDYTDHRGNKILRIEEIQSDWHQAGRKQGYKEPGAREKLDEQVWDLRKKIKAYDIDIDVAYAQGDKELGRKLDEEKFELVKQLRKIREEIDILSEQVPDAPFKKTWPEFVFKRVLREAVEKGYDKIQWAGGKENADRYKLSRHIQGIVWYAYPDGKYTLYFTDNNGRAISQRSEYIKKSEMENLVGKELADRIEEKAAASTLNSSGYKKGALEGLDLDIGGEGMKGFYDKMLPDYVRKYTKKWGAELTRTPEDRWELTITDAMRNDVLYQGQPLYSARKKEKAIKPDEYNSITPKKAWDESYKEVISNLESYRQKMSNAGKLINTKDAADAEAVIIALRQKARDMNPVEADKLHTEIARIGELLDSHYSGRGHAVTNGMMIKMLGADSMVKYLRNKINSERTEDQDLRLVEVLGKVDSILENTDTEEEARDSIGKYMNKTFKGRMNKAQETWINDIIESVYSGDLEDNELKAVFAARWKIPSFTDKNAAVIIATAEKLDGLKKGTDEYNILANELNDYMNSLKKHTFWEHYGTWEHIMMLSAPKSAIRNISGNLARLKDYNVEEFGKALMDMAQTAFRRYALGQDAKRSVLMPNPIKQFVGLGQGLVKEGKDFIFNRDTRDVEDTRDFASYIKYKDPIRGVIQRYVRFLMTDRPFKQAVLNDYMSRAEKLAQLNGVEFNRTEAMQTANEVADETLFNGSDEAIEFILQTRKKLNALPSNLYMHHIKRDKEYQAPGHYGIGSWLLTFAKVPYNVSKFAIEREYHLAAAKIFLRAAHTGYAVARKRTGGYIEKDKSFDVKAFVTDISKLGNGLLITYLGSWLWQMGLVHVRPDDDDTDKKLLKLEKLLGHNKFQINLSALRRYFTDRKKGKQEQLPTDHYATLDWFVPTSILLIGGIKAQQLHEKKVAAAGNEHVAWYTRLWNDTSENMTGLFEGTIEQVNGVLEMPMFSTFKKLKYQDNTIDKFATLVLDWPGRMVPAPLKYIKDTGNNTQRDTYAPTSSEQWLNNIKARIPMVADKLYPKVDMFGNDIKTYQTGNSIGNVWINPAAMSRYSSDPVAQKINSVYEQYGLKAQIPMDVRKSWTIKKASWYLDTDELPITLTAKEYYDYQVEFGKKVREIAEKMTVYKDDEKAQEKEVNRISQLYEDARNEIEKKILKARGLRNK